jgi:hypothetical protein
MVMTIGENMKKLTENLILSSNVRLKSVNGLLSDTRKTLNRFSADRKKMAAQQAKDLAEFMNGLSNNVQGMLKNARDTVEGFHKQNNQMGKEQTKNLTGFVNSLVKDVGSMLNSFQKDHSNMTKETQAKLNSDLNHIKSEVERILGEADELIGEYNSEMAQARKAWRSISAGSGHSQKYSHKTTVPNAGQKKKTARQTTRTSAAKGKNKSKTKSKNTKQKVTV